MQNQSVKKPKSLKRIRLLSAMAITLPALLYVFLYPSFWQIDAQIPNSNSQGIDFCNAKEDGAPCPLGQQASPCRVGRCRERVCQSEPAHVGTSCRDTDGNPCTVARCSARGTCDQKAQLQRDGTSCTDGTPGCNGRRQTCTGGQCLPSGGVGDPSQVQRVSLSDVAVEASEARVRQATSFADCCDRVFDNCEEQFLEALVPTPQGPRRTEADGGLPLRRKFCGTVVKYGTNDENEDPRDFTINIRPLEVSPYPDFVAGLVRTSDTSEFGSENCDILACAQRAQNTTGKVIHAEVTPDEHFYTTDGRFLPIAGSGDCGGLIGNKNCNKCISGWDCQSELESPNTEACVYGVYAYDHGEHSASSHTQLCCTKDDTHDHPEIHPFDAIWWRHRERNGWMFGVFQDDSNRYSFPYCAEDNNCNSWSQAPRDLTFRFPFRFPRRSAPQRVCLRHVRTVSLKNGGASIVRPLNVTTGAFVTPGTEVKTLVIGRERLLELIKEPQSEGETHIRIEGSVKGNDVVGQIILRVAVGCDERAGLKCMSSASPRDHTGTLFDNLSRTNPLVIYDKGDLGAGYFYAELTFGCSCP